MIKKIVQRIIKWIMANYESLKTAIRNVVYENGNNEITGQALQDILEAIVNSLGAGYQFANVATTETEPGTPDANVMYIAGAGTYPNFGGTVVPRGSVGVFRYNGEWIYSVIDVASWADASNKLYYNTQAGNVAAKTIQADGFTLQPGGWIKIHFDNANTVDNPTLNVNNTGAHTITFNGRSVSATNSWKAGETVAFYYDNYGVGIWRGIRLVELPDFVNVNDLVGQSTPFASASAARTAIPQQNRKPGLNITYLLSTGENTSQWVQDMFIGNDVTDWSVADNWKTVGPVSVSQNTETGHTDIRVGNETTPLPSVAEVEALKKEISDLSLGKFYGFFKDDLDLPEGDLDGYAYVGASIPFAIYVFKDGEWSDSGTTYAPPVGNGEDINTDNNNQLQFADRAYNLQNPDGMGYVILRKDKTFAEQVANKPNTIFEIRYDFELDSNVAIPANCVLKFNGGCINGEYTITGNNTCINAGLIKIFNTDITLVGSWNIAEAYPEWFGAEGDATNDDVDAIQKCINTFSKTYLTNVYYVSSSINIGTNKHLEGKGVNSAYIITRDVTALKINVGARHINIHNITIQNNGIQLSICAGLFLSDDCCFVDVQNLIITSYIYGIQANITTWNNSFKNIVLRYNSTGIYYNSGSASIMNRYENIYIGESKYRALSIVNTSGILFENLNIGAEIDGSDIFYIKNSKVYIRKFNFESVHNVARIGEIEYNSTLFLKDGITYDTILNTGGSSCYFIVSDTSKLILDNFMPSSQDQNIDYGVILLNSATILQINSNVSVRGDDSKKEYIKSLINTTNNVPSIYNGEKQIEFDGAKAGVKRYGPISQRPAFADIYNGFKYYDTTLNMEIINDNGTWVDANGRTPGNHSGELAEMPKFLQGTGHIGPTANDDGYQFTFTDDATYGDKTVWWNSNAGNGGAWVDGNGVVKITNP